TVRNTAIAFYAGLKDVLGCSGLVVRNCRMEDVDIGVTTEYAGSKNFYIADNVMLGRDDRNRLIGWSNFGKYKPTPLKSYYTGRGTSSVTTTSLTSTTALMSARMARLPKRRIRRLWR